MPFIDVSALNEKEVIPGYRGRTINTGPLTFMYRAVAEGAVIPEHAHMHEQVANFLKGKFELTVDGQNRVA
ncbi:MAG: cupin [Segetibacter sp.]|nr:cupin [Segetibacter sp.]